MYVCSVFGFIWELVKVLLSCHCVFSLFFCLIKSSPGSGVLSLAPSQSGQCLWQTYCCLWISFVFSAFLSRNKYLWVSASVFSCVTFLDKVTDRAIAAINAENSLFFILAESTPQSFSFLFSQSPVSYSRLISYTETGSDWGFLSYASVWGYIEKSMTWCTHQSPFRWIIFHEQRLTINWIFHWIHWNIWNKEADYASDSLQL